MLHVRICPGGGPQGPSLPGLVDGSWPVVETRCPVRISDWRAGVVSWRAVAFSMWNLPLCASVGGWRAGGLTFGSQAGKPDLRAAAKIHGPACKPGSVSARGRRRSFLKPAGCPADRAAYPGVVAGRTSPAPIFGLAPGGVCRASLSPGCWWALTPPFHPYLKQWSVDSGQWSVASDQLKQRACN